MKQHRAGRPSLPLAKVQRCAALLRDGWKCIAAAHAVGISTESARKIKLRLRDRGASDAP